MPTEPGAAIVVTVGPVELAPHRPELWGPNPFALDPNDHGCDPRPPRVVEPEWPRREELMARIERAVEVRDTYRVEQVGPLSWVVTHPVEPERCYVVDVGARSCTCPDYTARMNPGGLPVCKHLVAMADKWSIEIDWESEI
jgi:hypothetical protein